MNLAELYANTPVDRHSFIRVFGDIVFVRGTDGYLTEYRLLEDDELWLVHSEKDDREDIKAIKSKLGIQKQGNFFTAIKSKLGIFSKKE